MQLNEFEAMKHPEDKRECFKVDVLDEVISDSRRFIQREIGVEPQPQQ